MNKKMINYQALYKCAIHFSGSLIIFDIKRGLEEDRHPKNAGNALNFH